MNTAKNILERITKPLLTPYVTNRTRLSSINQRNPQDVYIVSYPKSGNTWFQYLVAGTVFGVNPYLAPDRLVQQIVPDIHYNRYYKRINTPMFFKSHALPTPEYQRVVYLLRDGRDVMISYYHFLTAKGWQFDISELVANPASVNKDIKWGKWADHVRGWHDNLYQAEMLFIRYEDLKQNTVNELGRFCEFVGIKRSEQTLNEVVVNADFEKMKNKEKQPNHVWENSVWPQEKSFVRSGQSGGYKREMPEQALQLFLNTKTVDTLLKFGYSV